MNSQLTLPAFDYRVKKQDGAVVIFDVIRRKYVLLTPEEWVRQHIIHYLIHYKSYPPALVAVEREISVCGQRRRFDLVCFSRSGDPCLIVECKAPEVTLSQKVFDQVFGYNLTLAAPYVAVTNGVVHYCGAVENGVLHFLPEFPDFREL